MDGITRRNLTYAAYMVSSMMLLFASAYTMTFHQFRDGVVLFAAAVALMIVFATFHVKQMRLLRRKGGALSILFVADSSGYMTVETMPTKRWIHIGRFTIRLGFMVTVLSSVAFFVSERYLYGLMALLPFPVLVISWVFARTMWLRRTRQ